MKKIIIIYYSAKGHTRALAEAISLGIEQVKGINVELLEISLEQKSYPWADIAQADALIFGSPTFMGSVAAPFKAFMDQSGDFWLAQPWKNKLAAAFTCGSSPSGDKLGTLFTLMLFAMQHGMIWLGQDHLGSLYTEDNLGLNSTGSWLGLSAQSISDKTKLISSGDYNTAKRFGERIASVLCR